MASAFHAPRVAPKLSTHLDPLLVDFEAWNSMLVSGAVEGDRAEHMDVTESRLSGLRLTGVTLAKLRMRDVVVEGCELSGAILEGAALTRVEFVDCRLSGTVLATATLNNVRFVGCRMDGVNLRMASATGTRFERCELPNADFSSCDLAGGWLVDCDLSSAGVSQTKLSGVRLNGSRLDGLVGLSAPRGLEIDATQIVPLAMVMFDASDIRVVD